MFRSEFAQPYRHTFTRQAADCTRDFFETFGNCGMQDCGNDDDYRSRKRAKRTCGGGGARLCFVMYASVFASCFPFRFCHGFAFVDFEFFFVFGMCLFSEALNASVSNLCQFCQHVSTFLNFFNSYQQLSTAINSWKVFLGGTHQFECVCACESGCLKAFCAASAVGRHKQGRFERTHKDADQRDNTPQHTTAPLTTRHRTQHPQADTQHSTLTLCLSLSLFPSLSLSLFPFLCFSFPSRRDQGLLQEHISNHSSFTALAGFRHEKLARMSVRVACV